MNIMKVQINRPWMDASIFDQSKAFVRISGTKFSNGFDTTLLSSEGDQKPDGDTLVKAFQAAGNNATLPAYPVTFIIAKDVTIRLTVQESSAKSLKEFMNKSMSTGVRNYCAVHSASSRPNHLWPLPFAGCYPWLLLRWHYPLERKLAVRVLDAGWQFCID